MIYAKMIVIACSLILLLAGCSKQEMAAAIPTEPRETQSEVMPMMEAMTEETLPEEESYVPSNQSGFDKQWMLGCKTMGWKFDDWMFKLGAVDATAEGLKLTHLGAEFPGFASLTIEPERYMEIWDGSQWKAHSRFDGYSNVIFEGTMENGAEIMTEESWDVPLAPGYYRLGAYYTATMMSGDSCRQMCYAKFRILDRDADALVQQCQEGLKNLLDQESFHIFRTDYMLQQRGREYPHYFTQETFKSGQDYYKDYRYYFYADSSPKGAQAELYRDGTGQHWNSNETQDRIWKPADFVTSGDFTMEAFGLECEPDLLGSISKDGNIITTILPTPAESFHQEIREQQVTYRFDDAGNLKEATLEYLFANGEKETEIHLEVKDTPQGELQNIIDSQ